MQQRGRRRNRKGPARSDRGHAFVGLDYVAVAAHNVGIFRICHEQQGLQMPENLVGAPVLRELYYRARKIAVELLELRFKTREQRKRVRGRSGKTGQNLVVIKTAELF